MAEYDCNPVGGGQPPGLYQKTLSQRKKKEAKLIVLRLSKQAGISFVKEWIVRWDVTLPRRRHSFPVHPNISLIPRRPILSQVHRP